MKKQMKKFNSWTPDQHKGSGRWFRCENHKAKILVTEEICRARALKPYIFQHDCKGCSRWKYYRDGRSKPRTKPEPRPKKRKGGDS